MHDDRSSGGSASSHDTHQDADKVRSAPVLRFEFAAELDRLLTQPGYHSGKPTGTTLVKQPDLRIVLMALKSGGRLEEHRASGPISVQVMHGRVRLQVAGSTVELHAGEIVALEPGVAHDAEALEDAAFLLTIGRTTYDHVSGHHENHPANT